MSFLTTLRKTLVPKPIRSFVRKQYLDFLFSNGLKKVERFARGETDDTKMLDDLIQSWDNKEWSAMNEFAAACMHYARSVEGPILECGSGLTTIIMGKIAQLKDTEVWALEHNKTWAERVEKQLLKHGIHNVHICVKPLKDYSDFIWYDPPLDTMPENFALAACDGPPGDLKGGRIGLIPIMQDKLADNCVILLDDIERERERAVADQWKTVLNRDYKTIGQEKSYALFD